MLDASNPDANPASCWKIADAVNKLNVTACPMKIAESIVVTMNVSIDTDGKSNPPGFTCALLGSGDDNVCALAAKSIFANGGPGGGGAQVGVSGHPGIDPTGPTSGGSGGDGGGPATPPPGKGAAGYPDPGRNGGTGDVVNHGGGGGGGGGAGAIRVASTTTIGGANVSPPPVQLTP